MNTPNSGSGIRRRDVLRGALTLGLAGAVGYSLWEARKLFGERLKFLQNAYDRGHVTQAEVIKKVTDPDARGHMVVNTEGFPARALELRDFNFIEGLRSERSIIMGWHGHPAKPAEQGPVIMPVSRGSGAILENTADGSRLLCTNNHVAVKMPDPSLWKRDEAADLAVTDMKNVLLHAPGAPQTIRYSPNGFPTNADVSGVQCRVEGYATNALIKLQGVLLDAAVLRVPGDLALLVTNSPIPASKFGGMSGSVLRHDGRPAGSIHAVGAVAQNGDELVEILSDTSDPRFDQCKTVYLSVSGPERLKKILAKG